LILANHRPISAIGINTLIVTTPTMPHYHVDNHDNANTTNGFVDVPF
jgi:hypothetical protein